MKYLSIIKNHQFLSNNYNNYYFHIDYKEKQHITNEGTKIIIEFLFRKLKYFISHNNSPKEISRSFSLNTYYYHLPYNHNHYLITFEHVRFKVNIYKILSTTNIKIDLIYITEVYHYFNNYELIDIPIQVYRELENLNYFQ